MANSSREADIHRAYGQFQELTRRVNDRSRQLGDPLSFVEHSLLRFIANTRGVRATDIAAAFSLNRSTVSRQIAGLADLGLVAEQEHDGAAPSRGRILGLTVEGQRMLEQATAVQQEHLRGRLAAWSDEEVHHFVEALARYNRAE